MTDNDTQKPVQVLNYGTAGPFIHLPLSQVEVVERILKSHDIRYWVAENSISLNGGPYRSTIDLGRDGNAEAVQAILDSFP